MEHIRKTKIQKMEMIMSRLPLDICRRSVTTEFRVRWQDVSRGIRNARMPMTTASIARVICKCVAKNLPEEEFDYILGRLHLKLVAVQKRVWHVITLKEPLSDGPVDPAELQDSVLQALEQVRNGRNISAEVHSLQHGELVFISAQVTSDSRSSAALYLATPPGMPVALTSSVRSGKLMKACVRGLGYASFEDAKLHGYDIPSLLRIHGGSKENVDYMPQLPEYCPVPVITKSGIDYTNRAYIENYVNTVLGPNPPVLTELRVNTSMRFFDQTILNKSMKLEMKLHSEDVAKTLKAWAIQGVISPTSKFFNVFNMLKSNKIDNFNEHQTCEEELASNYNDDSD
ncbi:uncharacterized protein [Battus philenor]|uniref:uncharacterized protein n=1 Tax=Battus philenor TaxID=42288 RepID=UPI0035CFCD95